MNKIVVIKAKYLSAFCLCVLCFFSGLISSKIFSNISHPQGRIPINSRVSKAHVINLDKKIALGGQTEYSAIDQFNDLGDNLTRLTDSDPENALTRLRTLGKAIEPNVAKALFQSWAKKNPDRALEAAQSSENRDIQSIALETVLSTTLEDNPDDVIRLLTSVRKSASSATMASRLFSRWADLDLDGLVTALATINSPLEHSEAIISIAIKTGKEDPQKALDWIGSLPNKTEQQKALSAMVIGWGQTDPKSASLYLDSKHNYEPQLAVALIGIWAKTDPNAAYLWSQNIKDASLRNSAPSQIICSMLTNSVEYKTIFDFANQLPDGNSKDDAFSVMISNWNGSDFKELADAVYRGGTNVIGTPGEVSLARKWIESDPKAATDYLKTLPAFEAAPALSREVLRYLAINDSDSAVNMAYELVVAGNQRIAPKVLQGLFEASPQTAEDFLIKVRDLPQADDLVCQFSASYAKVDPEAAIDWISHNLQANQRSNATATAFERWSQVDEHAASEYIAQMPQSDLKDIGAGALATSLASKDLGGALSWAASIVDGKIRRTSLLEIGKFVNLNKPQIYADAILNSGIMTEEIPLLEGHKP